MENPRAEKVAVVEEVKTRLANSDSVFITEYRGLTVDALSQLRRTLRPAGGSYKVYKNSLVSRAAADAGIEIGEHLSGPTALTFTETTPDGSPGDVVTVAKALRDFGKDHPELVIKGGYFDGAVVDADEIKALADVEPREVLLSKFAGLLAAPMSQFAALMQAVPSKFAYGIQALIDQGGAADAVATEEETQEVAEAPAAAETETAEAPAAEVEETETEAVEETADTNENGES